MGRITARLDSSLKGMDLPKKENMFYYYVVCQLRPNWKTVIPWSSLDKGEFLACKITSPLNNKTDTGSRVFGDYILILREWKRSIDG